MSEEQVKTTILEGVYPRTQPYLDCTIKVLQQEGYRSVYKGYTILDEQNTLMLENEGPKLVGTGVALCLSSGRNKDNQMLKTAVYIPQEQLEVPNLKLFEDLHMKCVVSRLADLKDQLDEVLSLAAYNNQRG